MNLANEIKWWDARFHQWEHNLVLSSEKMVHSEAFWTAAMVAGIVVMLIVLTILSGYWGSAGNVSSTPFWPFYPYGY